MVGPETDPATQNPLLLPKSDQELSPECGGDLSLQNWRLQIANYSTFDIEL